MQICFADFAYSHHPCLSLCVYPVYVNVCSQVRKILTQIHLYRLEHFRWMAQVPLFCSLTFIFKVKTFGISFLGISRKLWKIVQRYLPSNGVTANVVHRDIDLYFQGHTKSENYIIFNIFKTVSASEYVQVSLL